MGWPGVRAGRGRRCACGAVAQGAAGDAADLAGAAGNGAWEWLGAHGERLRLLAVEDEACGGVVDAEVGEVVIGQPGCGVAGQVAGVLRGGVEEDLAAGVGGHALPQLAGKLAEVLVGQGHRDPESACLGEHVLDRVRQVQEVVALVDHQRRVPALALRGAGPCGGGLPGARDHQRPDQPGGLLAE